MLKIKLVAAINSSYARISKWIFLAYVLFWRTWSHILTLLVKMANRFWGVGVLVIMFPLFQKRERGRQFVAYLHCYV